MNHKPQLIILPKGAVVMRSLEMWCAEHNVTAAAVSAVGAVENAEICYYDLPTKSYQCQLIPGAMEVLSLSGNVTIKEGKPFVHAHVTLGERDMSVKGGHLKEAVVAVTLECTIMPLEGEYERRLNQDIGLYLLT